MRLNLVRPFALAAAALAITACSDAGQIAGPAELGTTDISLARSAPGRPVSGTPSGTAALLVCPSTQSYTATGVIGREGGSLSAGGTTMTLPSGAVNRPTLFTLTVPASDYVEVEIVAENNQHFKFEKRVSITMDYSRCEMDLSEKPLSAWHIDVQTKALLEEMPGRKDKRANSVSFGTDHLSGYALAW